MSNEQLEERTEEKIIKGYKNALEICAQYKFDNILPCSFKENTLVFLEILFKNSYSELLLFTDDLSKELYEQAPLKKEALNFLNKSSNNKLLLTYNTILSKEEILNTSFLRTLIDNQENIKGFFGAWKLDKYTCNPPLKWYPNSFVVSDRIAYMCEFDNQIRDGSFNNETFAKGLAYDFFQIIKSSEEIYKNKK